MIAVKLVGLVLLYAFVAWSLLRPARPLRAFSRRSGRTQSLRLAPAPSAALRAGEDRERPSLAPYRPAA